MKSRVIAVLLLLLAGALAFRVNARTIANDSRSIGENSAICEDSSIGENSAVGENSSVGENSAVCENSAVSVRAEYGYNTSWKNYGGIDAGVLLPLGRHFEMQADARILTSGVLSASAVARPKFKLPVGEIFLDGTLSNRNLFKNKVSELVVAASIGYRMDYFSAQFGLFHRSIFDTGGNASSGRYVGESPLNLLYRAAFQVRPASSRWNAGGGISNYDEYEYERMWQPYFFINGHHDLNRKFSLTACIRIKPNGIFHQQASFYGIETKLGINYRF